MKTLRKILAIAALATISAVPQLASAASISIVDNTANDMITINSGQFEGGFWVNGSQIAPPGSAGSVSGSISLSESLGQINFDGIWITLGVALPVASKILFVEAGDQTLVSDILTLRYADLGNGMGEIFGMFVSDFENNLGKVSDYNDATGIYVEDVNGYAFGAPFLGGVALSDVPEPATLALFGLGLFGLSAARRKRV